VCPQLKRPQDENCVTEQHLQLLERDTYRLSPVARTVIHWLREAEYRPAAAPAVTLSPVDKHRLVVLKAVHEASSRYRKEAFPEARCRTVSDPIARILCPGGLDETLQILSDDAAVDTATKALRDLCAKGPCHMDETFPKLLKGHRRHIYLLAKKGVENVEHGEEAIHKDEPGAPTYERYVEAAFSLFRSSTFRYRNGIKGSRIEVNMSTGRWDFDHLLPSLVNVAVPNYLFWTPKHKPLVPVVVGWRPVTVPVATSVFLSSAIEWVPTVTQNERIPEGEKPGRVGYGASIGSFTLRPLKASTVEVGAYYMPEVMAITLGRKDQWTGRVSARWLADKVSVSVMGHKRGAWAVQLGLSDLNGLAFWLIR
jgi:hypothetical protein